MVYSRYVFSGEEINLLVLVLVLVIVIVLQILKPRRGELRQTSYRVRQAISIRPRK